MVDGAPVAMQPRTASVMARQADGSLKKVTRTMWWTRYGPVFDDLVGVPLPWTPTTAFAMRDANVDNFGRVLNHFFEVNQARTVGDVVRILKTYEGIPWVNTIAADRWGHALYADIGTVPHVTDDQAQACDTAVGQATFAYIGLPVLDGSRTSCDWGTDGDSVVPGIFGPGHEPSLLRRDYVTNSNDSYWLSNPKRPLEGFARIIGTERTERTLRTRMGLVLTRRLAGHHAFTRRAMQDLVFSDWSYAARITRGDLVAMCRQFASDGGVPTSGGPPVAAGNSCRVLARWDEKENLDSRGALLFRRFWDRASGAQPSPFSHPFDVDHPVKTPYGLDTNNPQVQTALGDAIQDFRDAHMPLDATVGSQQAIVWSGHRFPIHGGTGDPHGDFNAIWTAWQDGKGLTQPDGGSSYVQVVTWGDGACPNARTILTYSESENPVSPHHFDETVLFSKKRWVLDRFCERQIESSPALRVKVLTG
jgi:acyl-homoserine-lactone acylase